MAHIIPDIEIDGIVELQKQLDALMIQDGGMEDRIRDAVSKALSRARKEMSMKALAAMKSDPRKAHTAVKYSVYRNVLGGSVSLFNRKNSHNRNLIEPARRLKEGQRGGNRVPRSQRTEDLMSYYGMSRSFVLRFLNSGTGARESRYGNRGSITARRFFVDNGTMERAADLVAQFIEQEYKKINNG